MSTLDLPGREAYQSSHQDLSPAATTVAFDPVLPLVRIPVAAGEGDDTSKGPYVLAFRNEQTWRQSWLNCQDKIASQCEAGAKVGCSISAAKACQAPWWKTYFPFLNKGCSNFTHLANLFLKVYISHWHPPHSLPPFRVRVFKLILWGVAEACPFQHHLRFVALCGHSFFIEHLYLSGTWEGL